MDWKRNRIIALRRNKIQDYLMQTIFKNKAAFFRGGIKKKKKNAIFEKCFAERHFR